MADTTDRRRRRTEEGVDSISSLPDVILQHILGFTLTKFAIITSILSKRWRYVWCRITSLKFESFSLVASLNETLTLYNAPKIMSFHLGTGMELNVPLTDKWLALAISRNVENMSMKFWNNVYTIPDFFYINSSFKQLSLQMGGFYLVPRCFVSWPSLKKLSLRNCILSDESIAKILSSCPVLESLTLDIHGKVVKVLDLSKSLRLGIFEINVCWVPVRELMQIVAPHIHCLRLRSQSRCNLVDVSSLREAKLGINVHKTEKAELLKMLEKMRNVVKLTFGRNILEILSLAETCGLPFPMLMVKALTLETSISKNAIPGIVRVIKNSPD